MTNLSFFKGKKVFLTGHTGFKGSWMSRILVQAGAHLTGYALSPPTSPNLFSLSNVEESMNSVIGDIRDLDSLLKIFQQAQPEIVIHMAAQPIVRDSYDDPVYTYHTNVMGTVNILECIRRSDTVKSVLNVTTDKVYQNNEWAWGYRETDRLDGYDPYSNSKSCSELVTNSYRKSFLNDMNIPVSTARAGNVIGGGDFAPHRIVPDCVRAMEVGKTIIVRNPYSIRPYQHVLDPLFAYLMILEHQWKNPGLANSYNIGPNDEDCVTTGMLADTFCKVWGDGAAWENQWEGGPHEAGFLKLDCALSKNVFNWRPRWNVETALQKTAQWSKGYFAGENIPTIMDRQIQDFINKGND